ncbi:MAG: DUF1028 domain-containing protein [Alphaproteobacteria bacterium]|nr:DUF1028 domain-containing protein [Alphaproteobacteria bacterium]
MTFSIVARDTQTGAFGVAICSSSPAVAARCSHVRSGVGAVASQNITDPRLGARALDLLANGHTPADAVAVIEKDTEHFAYRQLLVIDAKNAGAVHAGAHTLGVGGESRAADALAAGNLLASADVPRAMTDAFTAAAASAHFGERLVAALEAGVAAGGEAGPVRSAGLLLVRDLPFPLADLRVDWSEGCPVAELRALWRIYFPQMEEYVTRAVDPRSAPSFGVPGDE